ncbi:MAG: flagellar biosynthesis anti-sigma factor FlgM [Clostridium sp.]|nr:flagellar biosynthesis anti-sigma factor FlgM [Acetatifactor muris]MCM1526389.1 flagellar biosynthesis anti-sigma factor FlgM [Bacteroides sp.]MCM1563248.1 flagellar biosynthesis anti-sigma factor FlgM [Clostridium sp.]
MRIEAYTQVQQIYKAQKTGRSAATGTASSAKDQLQISDRGKDIQTAKAAVAAAPDIREDLTASVKEQIQSGNYHVDNSSFAARLLEKYSALI